jgi:hypothetical protein
MFITTSNDYLFNNRILFFLRHGIAIVIPIALMWTLYHSVLQTWWLADDPALLKNIAEHGIISHFYQSDVWRSVSSANLTPWVILSLGIDWYFFGLEPSGFYLHHLLSFSLVLLIAYFVLNLFFSPLVCSLTLSIFVASIPSANIAQFLMTRHYLEGLGLSLLAILFYVKAIETHRLRWAIFGSIFYLLATTAKEIYVPLVVVLPWLLVGNWVQRWRMLIPFIAVAASYVLWRAYMLKLSYILTGYGSFAPKLDWNIILALPNSMAEVLGWHYSWQLLIICLLALSYFFIFLKYLKNFQWFQLLAIFIWIAVIFFSIVPVLSVLVSRYLFLPYFIFCLSVAFSLQFLINQQKYYITLALGLSVFMLGLKSITYVPATIQKTELLKQYHIEGNLILSDKNSNGFLVNPIGAYWYYQSLQWFRINVLKLPKGVSVCYDLCLCKPSSADNIYQYLQGQLTTSHVSEHAQNCGQNDAALSVKFNLTTDNIHWQFGPYKQGQYYVSISEQKDMITGQWFPLPTKGNFPIELYKILYIKLKYVSPEGWHTYSDTLVLDPTKKDAKGNVELIWKR